MIRIPLIRPTLLQSLPPADVPWKKKWGEFISSRVGWGGEAADCHGCSVHGTEGFEVEEFGTSDQ